MRVLRGRDEATALFQRRRKIEDEAERESVAAILRAVRERGDEAVAEFTERFDGVRVEEAQVPPRAFERAVERVPNALRDAIHLSAERVRSFYDHQPKEGFVTQEDGSLLGQLVRPLERVACYVPGGQAPLFSTLIMTAVPAQVAGVPEVVIASPPDKAGAVPDEVLVAARALGLDTV